uniref:Trans-1,2-dihydrobenzene-1,2-diol dehydrogenase n=1 Tax=Tabanus bromius TaxID=304241 RepID=A0A0K8TTM1_TABBR
MALSWGIASAGKISHDFVCALSTLPDDEHKVVSVGARDKARAEEFAKLHGIPNAYGSYIELAKDKSIDVVYIGALNPAHYDIAMLMLEHGKHILCEKPLCMNEKQARKLINYAELKKLFLMEAIWSRFFPSYQYLRKQINAGVLGEIKEVEAGFGFDLGDVDRLQKRTMGGGTILDLGVYVIQVSQWVFQEPPKSVKATGKLNSDGVDISMEADVEYSSGRIAKIRTSAEKELDNVAVIKGTKGQITLKQFWCPVSIIDIDGKEKVWPLPESKLKPNFTNSVGLRFEAMEVRRCIQEGKLQSDVISHNESILIAKIEDDIRKQIGVVYEEDKS